MATRFTVIVTLSESSELDRPGVARLIAGALKGQASDLEVMGGGAAHRRMDDETKKAIIQARQDGSSYGELAETFDVSTAAINKVLRDAGLTQKREAKAGNGNGGQRRSATKVHIGADGSVQLTEVKPKAAHAAAAAVVAADNEDEADDVG